MRPGIFDHERVSFNVARLRTHGETYEVAIDPDAAIAYREGRGTDIREVLKAEKVFFDARKGELASEERQKEVFGTADPLAVAKEILARGEVQLSSEYREKLRADKLKRILGLIHVNAVDPRTKLPHPPVRIENALRQANIHIDEHKRAEDQVADVVRALTPILPIRFETRTIQLHVPANYAPKLYGAVAGFGKIKKEDWLNDGSWLVDVEIPAGLQTEFFDEMNSRTHGSVEAKILE